MDKKICVLVCCHKKDIHATITPYMPIHVGADLHKEELNMISDNTGKNISNKNATFCELTGLYWAWKNLHNVAVIGLCHYRRYFDFHHVGDSAYPETEISTERFHTVDLSIPQGVIDDVNNGMLIVPQANKGPISLYNDYCLGHISDDIKVLEDILKQRKDEYILKAYFHVMHQNNKFYPYNMFLMKWEDFNAYCTWLFDVLFELEKRLQ